MALPFTQKDKTMGNAGFRLLGLSKAKKKSLNKVQGLKMYGEKLFGYVRREQAGSRVNNK